LAALGGRHRALGSLAKAHRLGQVGSAGGDAMGVLAVSALLAKALGGAAPGLFGDSPSQLRAIGWAGFLDGHFMFDSLAALLLATLLGAAIGYHPKMRRTVDSLTEADMPKVYIMYAFIGAVIGVTVREFGMVIGVVVFGIGGLIRFRSTTDSTRDTARLIVVTLVGLVTGIGLPHLAAITALFTFVLIWLFDSSPACRVRVDALPQARLAECAKIYREALASQGCKIISEQSYSSKGRVDFVIRLPGKATRESVNGALGALPPDVCGDIDWQID
jgi:uncharacterized membrane protein YhiD involved in acid resistance